MKYKDLSEDSKRIAVLADEGSGEYEEDGSPKPEELPDLDDVEKLAKDEKLAKLVWYGMLTEQEAIEFFKPPSNIGQDEEIL